MDSHHIVQSVVRLTEDSEESTPPSVEASPCKSPDVIVEEEITEDVAKLNIDHPLFVKVREVKMHCWPRSVITLTVNEIFNKIFCASEFMQLI